jgi:uncharacterized protein with von Willebrand factor type A (vWA) domain
VATAARPVYVTLISYQLILSGLKVEITKEDLDYYDVAIDDSLKKNQYNMGKRNISK